MALARALLLWLACGLAAAQSPDMDQRVSALANELRCLANVTGSRYDPGELVRYCEEQETGDEAELACVARWR